MERRQFLQYGAGAAATLLTAARSQSYTTGLANFPPQQDRLLEEVESRAAKYFYIETNPETGLVRDRASVRGRETRRVASIAATGFGLSALCIADDRGYLETNLVRRRVERTLEFLCDDAIHANGFFPHFLDMHTGQRVWNSEFSSIDTAWLLCGVLHASAHFQNPRITELANEIYARVDWFWMLDEGETLRHGWTPEKGFLPYRWDAYSELLAMYVLAIGAPENAIPAACWDAWKRPVRNYSGLSYIETVAPLFAHQYSHAWLDFRGRRDRYADYFENSRDATEAHRLFCVKLRSRFPWYGQDMWGITASDSRGGYLAWGGAYHSSSLDGTLVPCAAGGSIAFMPRECGAVLENMLARYGRKIWGRYGFVDAFHPEDGWYGPDVVGIDQGIMMLMAENARTGGVWEAMMSVPAIERGMRLVRLARSSS